MWVALVCRLSFDRVSRERRLGAEAYLNRQESRAAVVFAGLWLFLIPFGFGFFVSRGLAEPIITGIQACCFLLHVHPASIVCDGMSNEDGIDME
jgi:predicted signal transduction protein with EAL and GGDEF domain